MEQDDLFYREFSAQLRMTRDLVQEILGERWAERVDFNSSELVKTSFVFQRIKHHDADIVWKFRRKDGGEPVYIYVLMEFQLPWDPPKPVRFMVYVGLFCPAPLDSQLAATWTALSMAEPTRLEKTAEWFEARPSVHRLRQSLPPTERAMQGAFGSWLRDIVLRRFGSSEVEVSVTVILEEVEIMPVHWHPREKPEVLTSPVAELFLLKKSDDWVEIQSSMRRLGRSLSPTEGGLREMFAGWLQEVILPGLGPSGESFTTKRTLEELETTLAESIDRWNRENRQEGEARLVLRQLRLKFGPLEPAIEDRVRSADPDRLLDWGERVLTAQSLQEVFRD